MLYGPGFEQELRGEINFEHIDYNRCDYTFPKAADLEEGLITDWTLKAFVVKQNDNRGDLGGMQFIYGDGEDED